MHIYSLHEIVTSIEQSFRELLGPWEFLCTAEVIKVKPYATRRYIDLVQYDEHAKVMAKIQGIIRDQHIVDEFVSQVGRRAFDEIVGKTILLRGTCSFHHLYGLSISIKELSAAYVLGQMQQQITAIRTYLQNKGIYEHNTRCKLDVPPYKLAIISSPTSEGLQDFCTIIDKSPYVIGRECVPATVHGNKAITEVAAALEQIHAALAEGAELTAVCIIRGGGGREGFQRQNDQRIAELICMMPVPVIVAIGHTSDTSLLDEVCRYAAQTPSEAAMHLLTRLQEREGSLYEIYTTLDTTVHTRIATREERLITAYQASITAVTQKVEEYTLSIHQARSSINAFAPETMYKKGYATMHTAEGAYLSGTGVKSLVSGDKITIRTNNGSLDVSVE